MEEFHKKVETLYKKIDVVIVSDSFFIKLGQLGYLMNLYYDFFMNSENNKTVLYTFYLNQYATDLNSVKKLIDNKTLNA